MKKLISLFVTFLFTTLIFAQTVASAGITDKDVKNYAKNYKKIVKLLESTEDNSDVVKINSDFEKLGISGPNSLYKVTVITSCATSAVQQYTIETNPTLATMYATMGINVTDFAADKNPEDYAVVYANIELLIAAME